jgi:hypothetical protein
MPNDDILKLLKEYNRLMKIANDHPITLQNVTVSKYLYDKLADITDKMVAYLVKVNNYKQTDIIA